VVAISANLSLAAAQGQVAALLSPNGVVGSAVTDILAAADTAVAIADTANAVLSDFKAIMNDPIQISFSEGQPYSGTFITAPTVALMPLSLSLSSLASSTIGVALLSAAQIAVLAARTGIDILNDVDLATAMASLFTEYTSNVSVSFSIDLTDSSGFAAVTYADTTDEEYAVPVISINPTENLTYFVASISSSFPNTPGIAGVAASVWVDGLGISVSISGETVPGVPYGIDSGVYADITSQALSLVPTATPVALVDYSYQQNYLNVVVALSIDNGLVDTFNQLMGSSMVTAVTTQVIINRLGSVAARGDTSMLLAMITVIGPSNVPNSLALQSSLITALQPTDVTTTYKNPTFTAAGVTLTTNANAKDLAGTVTDVQAIGTALGTTIQNVFSQNTCSSEFCSQQLWNVPMMKAANQTILAALADPTTIKMANMFS
jgi:hypothetical protein